MPASTDIRNSPSGKLKPAGSGGGIQPPAGQIDGTDADPLIVGITESTGDELAIGQIDDGQFLKRSGLSVIGEAPGTNDVTNDSDVPGTSDSDALESLRGNVFDLSGAAIALTSAHRLGYVRASHTSGCTVTITAADWEVGDYCIVEWSAAGQPTLTAGVGTTLNKPSLKTLALNEQYAVAGFKCVSAGVFTVFGNLADA